MLDCNIINDKLKIIADHVKIKHLYGIDVKDEIFDFLKLKHDKKNKLQKKICKLIFNEQ